ncbi:hypothetical protein ACFQYP_08960 [Nonomuraea antimicrobica]
MSAALVNAARNGLGAVGILIPLVAATGAKTCSRFARKQNARQM